MTWKETFITAGFLFALPIAYALGRRSGRPKGFYDWDKDGL